MSNLTAAQIEQLWLSNGGSPTWAPTMAAVALAESGGNPSALNNNPNTKDYSVGLWQINYYGSLLGPRTQQFGAPATLQADPNAQAKAAIALLGNGAGISNWEGDAVGAAATRAGGPLTAAQAAGVVASPGSPAQTAAVQNLLPIGEGARWYGLLTASECAFGSFSFLGNSGCLITRGSVRKIKGYTVMTVGGFGIVFGIALVVGIGLRSPAGRSITAVGKALPGPVGTASRVASAHRGAKGGEELPRGVRRAPAGSRAPRAGQRSGTVRFAGRPATMSAKDRRELTQRRAEDDRRRARQASDARERAEGFPSIEQPQGSGAWGHGAAPRRSVA